MVGRAEGFGGDRGDFRVRAAAAVDAVFAAGAVAARTAVLAGCSGGLRGVGAGADAASAASTAASGWRVSARGVAHGLGVFLDWQAVARCVARGV